MHFTEHEAPKIYWTLDSARFCIVNQAIYGAFTLQTHSATLEDHLTLPYGLMLVVGQRCHQKTHFGHGAPVVEDADAPHAGTQWLVERRAVVGELGSGVDQDVVGGGNDVGWVDPHHSDGDVGAFAPLLHAHRLVHGAH